MLLWQGAVIDVVRRVSVFGGGAKKKFNYRLTLAQLPSPPISTFIATANTAANENGRE